MRMRIGIMGGMFDPVHLGHTTVARNACDFLDLDHVRLVPCGVPNHRDLTLCSAEQRLDMLQLATRDHTRLVVDDREVRRAGTSYTVDTLSELQAEFPGSDLYFILGSDAFATLDRWHRWRQLFELCHFIVIRRPGFSDSLGADLEEAVKGRRVTDRARLFAAQSGLVFQMPGLDSPMSSSLVRQRIDSNQPLDNLLDPAVAHYLRQHQLYRNAVTH